MDFRKTRGPFALCRFVNELYFRIDLKLECISHYENVNEVSAFSYKSKKDEIIVMFVIYILKSCILSNLQAME